MFLRISTKCFIWLWYVAAIEKTLKPEAFPFVENADSSRSTTFEKLPLAETAYHHLMTELNLQIQVKEIRNS
jgi:hypothetical protein